jgi:hypothetical protein
MQIKEPASANVSSVSADPSGAENRSDLREFLEVLGKMAASWPRRAAVKKEEPDVEALFDETLPDFLIDLIPFKEHPHFTSASEEMRQRVLSCGWLAYNEKTIAIETKVISPACMHVIQGDIPGVTYEVCKEAMSQTFVDEAYHTLLLVNACRVTRQRRGLCDLRIPEFSLIKNMMAAQNQHSERWQKLLIQLLCATVSEVSISDYLKLLSGATTIQPLNVLTTEIHRRDEAAHTGLFKKMGQMIYLRLSGAQREFFVQNLPKPLAWFSSLELNVWRSMLQQIGFPHAEQTIDDCAREREYDLARRDFSALNDLMCNDLGVEVTDFPDV